MSPTGLTSGVDGRTRKPDLASVAHTDAVDRSTVQTWRSAQSWATHRLLVTNRREGAISLSASPRVAVASSAALSRIPWVRLRAVPRELFAIEQQHLRPLPAWVPEVYRLHERMVDVEGYVTVNSNRYSVPVDWIGRRVEVRETSSKIEIQLDARHLVTHQRVAEAEHRHILLAEHRPPRGVKRPDPHPEEALILKAVPEIAGYVTALKQHSRKMVVLALRQLLRMVREYPREPLLAAVAEAARYGLYDLDRVERMILRQIARDYFLLNNDPES